MERISLNANVRSESGKGAARSLRRSGRIPAVLCGKGVSTSLSLDPSKVRKLIMLGHAESTLIDLKLEGAADKSDKIAILRDYQKDPLTGELLHVDFFEVSMDEKIRVTVPIELTGKTPLGVVEGGLLQLVSREVEIECLPSLIPDNILADASALMVGDSLHVSDLSIPDGIRFVTEPEHVILNIAAPVSQEKMQELLSAPAPGEAAKEPEVIKKPVKEGEKAAEKEGKA
ncbi:MAG: 50S ribosomal protein L25 [Nitrospirae bacterium]|nr:50S ribosomal protein L25 [Nitrospirota bacterium]